MNGHVALVTGSSKGLGADIANAVKFLALPVSGFITGQTLHDNGGMTPS